MTLTLTLHHQTYSIADLLTLDGAEAGALQFCQQWLRGQTEFHLMTSGSTGAPKQITLKREQMAASARLTGQAVGLRPGQHALVCLPTHYIAGQMMLVRGLELGLHLTIVTPQSNPLAALPLSSPFDFTAFTPMQLHKIIHETPTHLAILNRMQAILVGGGEVSLALEESLQQITAPIYHTYGMTETVSHVALRRLNGDKPQDYFTPLPEVTLGQDERGCLTITSVLTQHQTLITNDLVELHPDGTFRWRGRWDNVINSGGVKIQAEKVELAIAAFLQTQQQQRRFFVGALPHAELGQQVVAVIEGSPLPPEIVAQWSTQLAQTLTPYEIPRQIRFLAQFYETPTGKIDRAANLAACS